MTHKDYIRIAAVIEGERGQNTVAGNHTLDRLARAMAAALAADNPRFDAEKFLRAAGEMAHRGEMYHPQTKEPAPAGQQWVRNARFGGYQLEAIGTPFTASVSSETYWSA